jgi:glycosyltransferase involved in cell wall biosynthesis
VLASSHSTARFCADHYKYSVSDIEVIHSAVDIGRFKPGTAGSGRGGPEVLFVGRPVSDKGIDDLITAVLAVRESRPCVRLRIIGNADDDTMAGLSKRIADAEAQNTVEFVGYVPHSELPEHYRRCDIFAAPSTYEPGPGNIYLEAMACGKPIVACNSGGAPEVVLDGETGILVKPGDASAIAGAIGLLAGDGECRKRLGTAGRKWIESRFTWEKYTDRVERIYSELLA